MRLSSTVLTLVARLSTAASSWGEGLRSWARFNSAWETAKPHVETYTIITHVQLEVYNNNIYKAQYPDMLKALY